MKKIKIVVTLTATLIVSVLNAQEQPQPSVLKPLPAKVTEYGIGLSSLNSFSLQYRWGNENRLYRLQGNIGGSSTLSTPINNQYSVTSLTTPLSINCGLSFSILKIKSISEKIGLMYGTFLGGGYNQMLQSYYNVNSSILAKTNSQITSASLGLVLGGVYKINSSFLVYAEIDPSFTYTYSHSHYNNPLSVLSSYNIHSDAIQLNNLSNSNASLTIVYRITK